MATGEILSQQRLLRKLSLASVAKALHLDEKLLADIEQDKIGQLATVYKNGYIRSYARFLQIPEDEIELLLSPSDVVEPPIRNIFSEAPKRNPMDRWLRATSYVLASLLIGTLAWQFTHEAVRLSQSGSRPHNGADVSAMPESIKSQPQVQEFGAAVNASIATLGALHNSNTDGLDTAEQAWAAISRPVVSLRELADDESHLQLSVSADSWVEIADADGQELEMDLLRAGSEKSYHGRPPFRFLFGRASSVRLSMDGETIDLVPFTRDEVAQLSWPQKMQAGNLVDGQVEVPVEGQVDNSEPDDN